MVVKHGAPAPVKIGSRPGDVRRVMRALTVRGTYRGVSGHDHHTRQFVRHLRRAGIAVQLLNVPGWSRITLPADLRDAELDVLSRPVGARVLLHFCPPHLVVRAVDQVNVNYTMFEATRIPAGWIAAGRRHDLIIVPTASSLDAWRNSGFREEQLRACPLGVSADRFYPDVPPLELTDRSGRPLRSYRTRVLNVSELSPRKNLVALLRVWIRATTRADDAILVVKIGRSVPASAVRFMREVDAMERAIGKTREDAAPVLFVERVFLEDEMPRLFAAATHYWSMSHGEGWDQPMMEAAATDLRLIAPAHSAYAAYLDDEIAAMVPARAVPAVIDSDPGLAVLFAGAEWWEPDEDAAATAIRAAIDGRGTRRASPRQRVATQFTWEQATARLIAILDDLHRARGLED